MRERSLARWMWLAVALGAPLASGCGGDDETAGPAAPGGAGGAGGGTGNVEGGAGGGTAGAANVGGEAGSVPFELDPNRVLADVAYLASPELEGRATGSSGNAAALDYVEQLFTELGLEPLGDASSYRQGFGYDQWQVLAPTVLTVAGTTLTAGTDYASLWYSGSADVTAELVFVGYGMTVPAFDAGQYPACPLDVAGYDDYAGVDVTGKIALVLRHGPNDDQAVHDACPGNAACEGSPCLWNFGYKAANAALHGAAAVVIVPDYHHTAGEVVEGSMGTEYYVPTIATLGSSRTPFETAIADLATWAAAIDAAVQPSSHPTGVTATVELDAAVVPIETANLLAALPGTHPTLGEEIVVVGGHIDHLGEDLGSGQIFLGADDNASGTAVTMELARAMVLGDTVPARTVLFAAWNGEEAGLVGSCFYVNEPTVSLSDIMVMFSLDMVGGGNGSGVDVYGGTQSSYQWLMDVIEGASAADSLGFDVSAVAPLDASDHACFAQAGRPAVMLSTAGTHGYYHTPADTIDNVTVQDLEAATRVAWATLRTLASGEEGAYTQQFRAGASAPPPRWTGRHRLLRGR